MAHHEMYVTSNEACSSGPGYYEAKVYVRAGWRRVEPIPIDMGRSVPSDDPYERLSQIRELLPHTDRTRMLACGVQRICLNEEHEDEPQTEGWRPSARLERMASYIIAPENPFVIGVEPPIESKIPGNGIGKLRIKDVPQAIDLDPVIFLPAIGDVPVTSAVELPSAREGSVHVALRGLEQFISAKEVQK